MALKVSFGAAAMLLSLSMLGLGLCPARVRAQGYPYFVGQIITVAFPWCPQGFLPLNGESLSISANPALYSLIGTIYGGDGIETFNLPDTTLTFLMGAHGQLSGRQLHVGEVLSGSVQYAHPLTFHANTNPGPNTTLVTIDNQNLPLVMKAPNGLVVTYCICNQGLYPSRP